MPRRPLTDGEKTFLTAIFGLTLPYNSQQVDTNDRNWGGANNSITPLDIPYMAKSIWNIDYSNTQVSMEDRGIFVHEMMHVWQYYHGVDKGMGCIKNWWKFDDYRKSYEYTLGFKFWIKDYNIEAQASIVQDYYLVSSGGLPNGNVGPPPRPTDYIIKMLQVRSAGSPVIPAGPSGIASLALRGFDAIRN